MEFAKIRIVGRISVIIGFCLMLAGGYTYLQARNFITSAVRAQGTVVQLVERSGGKGRTFCPVFSFVDTAGKEHKIYSNWGSKPPRFNVGEKVTVLYNPRSPEDARLDTFFELWGLPTILSIIGAVHTGAWLLVLHFSGKQNT